MKGKTSSVQTLAMALLVVGIPIMALLFAWGSPTQQINLAVFKDSTDAEFTIRIYDGNVWAQLSAYYEQSKVFYIGGKVVTGSGDPWSFTFHDFTHAENVVPAYVAQSFQAIEDNFSYWSEQPVCYVSVTIVELISSL